VIEVVCAGCDQEEGPFAGIREAERILAYYGWHYGPPVEAWRAQPGWVGWAPGFPSSFHCQHCALQRSRELKACKPVNNHEPNALQYRFAVKCSRGHRKANTLHTGTLHVWPTLSTIEWTTQHLGVPRLGERQADRQKITLRCPSCRLDRQMQVSLLTEALRALVEAQSPTDRFYRIVLDIAHIPR
jgi:hypothetical protein